MATLVTDPVYLGHDSDATYRASLAAFLDAMTSVNPAMLTRTNDTGQVFVPNAVKPATEATPDVMLFKFSDGVGPDIFLKFTFGTGSSQAYIRTKLSIGTGTNGAGQLTGQTFNCTDSNYTGTASKPIAICCSEGSLTIIFGSLSPGLFGRFGLSLSRYADPDGVWKSTGFMLLYAYAQTIPVTEIHNFSFTSGRIDLQVGSTPDTSVTCLRPYAKTSLSAGGYTTPMPVYGLNPYLVPMPGFVMLPLADCAQNSDVVVPVLGATPRNYRQSGIAALYSSAYGYCCLWE